MIGTVSPCLIHACIMCTGIDSDNHSLISLATVKIESVSHVKHFLCVSMFPGSKFNTSHTVKVLHLAVFFFLSFLIIFDQKPFMLNQVHC